MNFKKVCSATINGKRWTIGFGIVGKNNDGLCNYDQRRIFIRANRNGRTRSLEECVIHEVAHAVFPQIEEDAILHLADMAARILAKMKNAETQK